MSLPPDFWQNGWCRFQSDEAIMRWASAARRAGRVIAADPIEQAQWLRSGGTWFVGVDALPSDPDGNLPGGPALDGAAIRAVTQAFGVQCWHKAQLSVIYPGYPKPGEEESAAAFRFRRDRDAAHVDGLLPIGRDKRRFLKEPHGFVLGIPLTATPSGASPMVIWEGSHEVMRAAFRDAFSEIAPPDWSETDVTELYQDARRRCFETCKRVAIEAQPGEAYLVHRLALHGVAPWEAGVEVGPEGRMIAYFRPELEHIEDWLA